MAGTQLKAAKPTNTKEGGDCVLLIGPAATDAARIRANSVRQMTDSAWNGLATFPRESNACMQEASAPFFLTFQSGVAMA